MKNSRSRQIFLPLLTAFIWGSAFIAQGSVADKIGAFTFNASRAFIAVIALFCVMIIFDKIKKKRGIKVEKTDVKGLLTGGVLCGVVLFFASNLQQFGIIGATENGGFVLTEGDAAFITALYTVLVPITCIFMGKKPAFNVIIAALIALVGLFFICNVVGGNFTIYHVLLFLSAASFTCHILLIDRFTQSQDGVKLSCVQFLVMGFLSIICSILFDRDSVASVVQCGWQLLYVGVFSSAIAYTLQIISQKGANPTIVTIILSFESLFALCCELFLDLIYSRPINHTPLQFVGCFLMVVAVVVAQLDFTTKKSEVKS